MLDVPILTSDSGADLYRRLKTVAQAGGLTVERDKPGQGLLSYENPSYAASFGVTVTS